MSAVEKSPDGHVDIPTLKARRAGLVAPYKGVERNTKGDSVIGWSGAAKVLFLVSSGVGAWGLVFWLIQLFR